jgi:hypothetical protein
MYTRRFYLAKRNPWAFMGDGYPKFIALYENENLILK